MNIFYLDEDPIISAQMIDDVRLPKMIVESTQMLASALLANGADPESMPLTKSGTRYKGGYRHHPCTKWAGLSTANFSWLAHHAFGLLSEYRKRFKPHSGISLWESHACGMPLFHLMQRGIEIKDNRPDNYQRYQNHSPPAQAMPDEFKHSNPVVAYRQYYISKVASKGGVRYAKRQYGYPHWWSAIAIHANQEGLLDDETTAKAITQRRDRT